MIKEIQNKLVDTLIEPFAWRWRRFKNRKRDARANEALKAFLTGPQSELYRVMLDGKWGFLQAPFDQITLLSFYQRFQGAERLRIGELGVARGDTANRIVEFLKAIKVQDLRYWGIDTLDFLDTAPNFQFDEMTFIKADRSGLSQLPEQLDALFVDACHCSECVYQDSITGSAVVRSGGFMLFHDTSLTAQYPNCVYSRERRLAQHYKFGATSVVGERPLAVIEGIAASRPKWHGEWKLIVQDNDDLEIGGIRIYEKL